VNLGTDVSRAAEPVVSALKLEVEREPVGLAMAGTPYQRLMPRNGANLLSDWSPPPFVVLRAARADGGEVGQHRG
jgi:hypothetical protein